ncbi:unnamed protein product [Chironomus riparius]|uniref:Ig-like domain-containing protein n=1 Tax=Chironomus riparius TaxID=315576 RepID=A0A9N9S1Z8_9DIPT|nr:unnamed protein product [Chironomus riparius]
MKRIKKQQIGYFLHIFFSLTILFSRQHFVSGKSIDNSLTQNYQPLEYENPSSLPKFISRGQSYRAVIDDTIVLPCATQDLGSNILLWRRGSSVVTASNLMITRDPRFRLLDEYSLQIKGVRPQDAGDYICQIGDAENRDLVHTVEILVPPTVRAHPETGHVTARKGSSVTLECKASGNPVPNVHWIRVTKREHLSDAPRLSEGPTLTLEHVERKSSGIYRCVADNGVRDPVSIDMQLTVLSPPELETERAWVHAGEGHEAQLVCIVHGEANPELMWYQDSFLLDPTDRRTMDSRGDRHILTIRNIQQSDFGNYSCVADNALGRAKKYIEVSGRPGPAQFHSPLYSRSRDVYNLTWSIESIPKLEEIRILYRKLMMNETYQQPGRWHELVLTPPHTRQETPHHFMTYTIRGLENNSVYEAIVQAKNQYGWNEVSDIYQFYTQSNNLMMTEEEVEMAVQSEFSVGNRLQLSTSICLLLTFLIAIRGID